MRASRRLSRRGEAGYVALVSALLFSSVFLGLAALGVDTARWYVESEQLQKAADAASLAGVVYMPGDLAKARVAALATAERNGFANSGTTTVTVAEGSQPSQLVVTISSRVSNAFAASFGSPTTTLSRAATADYTAPAPMGSPCNTFGNEPPSTTGTAMVNSSTGSAQPSPAFPNCSTNPQFWAAVEGPATDKVQGDRYGTIPCTGSSTYRCAGGKNSEYRSDGYFFAVHVEPAAVGRQLDVQIYDPAFVQTGKDCASIPTRYNNSAYVYNRMSQFTPTDGLARYKNSSSIYCSGDYLGTSQATAPTTTFVLRQQTDTGDPMNGAVVSGCTQQFRGTYATPDDELRQWTSETGSSSYPNFNPELARVFHQWVSLCTFVPARSGDYFLQVRTNRTFGGSEIQNVNATGAHPTNLVSTGNSSAGDREGNLTAGVGVNSFALRVAPTTDAGLRGSVAMAGYSRMPVLQNATGGTATFNLVRALPATRGQYISFSFYDVSDCGAGCTGSVRVVRPSDATGSIRNTTSIVDCRSRLDPDSFQDAPSCKAKVAASTNNGQLETMLIPIPADYSCNADVLWGCWFSVEITFDNGANVSDITTWDANIDGDPVRLVE